MRKQAGGESDPVVAKAGSPELPPPSASTPECEAAAEASRQKTSGCMTSVLAQLLGFTVKKVPGVKNTRVLFMGSGGMYR